MIIRGCQDSLTLLEGQVPAIVAAVGPGRWVTVETGHMGNTLVRPDH
jgi:hypothetical protein